MSDPKTIIEGSIKYRDGKKWKPRWCVVSKLSPVADCIHLQLYRDSKERCQNGPTKASLSLEGFLGMETCFTLDKESNTMALICPEVVVVVAFDSRELLIQWQVKIRAHLVEEQQHLVQISHIPPKSKLPCGPARLHLQDYTFCLTAGIPPRLLGTWPLKELRKFGVVENKFCFEGGSLCGRGEGVHVLLTNQAEDLTKAFDLATRGKLAGKRKVASRKNSVCESSTRVSLQSKTTIKSFVKSSTESSRALLGDYPGNNTCKLHYRWPSSASHSTATSVVAVSDVESMETVSMNLSDIQEVSPKLPHRTESSNPVTNQISSNDKSLWKFDHCSKCGRHYCTKTGIALNNRQRSYSPDDRRESRNFATPWALELRPLFTSTESVLRTRNSTNRHDNKRFVDRASLSSQSSHSSSSTSSGSSEYSVPRNCLETLYDRPRSIHINNGVTTPKSPSKVTSIGNSPIWEEVGDRTMNTSGQPTDNICYCIVPFSSNTLPRYISCSCLQSRAPAQNESQTPGQMTISRKSCTSLSLPKTRLEQVSTLDRGFVRKENAQTSVAVDICTCCLIPNPCSHYAIPRTALANMYLRELKETKEDCIAEGKLEPVTTPKVDEALEQYDVPRKFKEHLNINQNTTALLPPSINDQSQRTSCLQTHGIVAQGPVSSEEAFPSCSCQNLMTNDSKGSLVSPSSKPISEKINNPFNSTITSSLPNNLQDTNLNSLSLEKKENTLEKLSERLITRETLICTCKKMFPSPVSIHLDKQQHVLCDDSTAIKQQCQSTLQSQEAFSDYVNMEHANISKDKSEYKCEEPTPNIPNYVNLTFIESLPLYENSDALLKIFPTKPSDFHSSNVGEKSRKPPVYPKKTPPGPIINIPLKNPIQKSDISDCNSITTNSTPCFKGTSEGLYNIVSFTGKKCSLEAEDSDNYLLMEPVVPWKLMKGFSSSQGNSYTYPRTLKTHNDRQKPDSPENIITKLPLCPFIPYLLPSKEIDSGGGRCSLNSNTEKTFVSPFQRRKKLTFQENTSETSLLNSLGNSKKTISVCKISNSAATSKNQLEDTKEHAPRLIGSPKPSPVRKYSFFSKLPLRSKDKSHSTDEISPISSEPSSPSYRPLENLQKKPAHRSADCLKLSDEHRLSEDELDQENYDVILSETNDSSSITKKSPDVPCKPKYRSSQPSPSDSGVSVSLPLSGDKETTLGKISPHIVCSFHGSLPRKLHKIECREIIRTSKRPCCLIKRDFSDHLNNRGPFKKTDECTSQNIQAYQQLISPDCPSTTELLVTASSSSSDMSDYIETLSLCSHSSTSSGSSCECMHAEEIYVLAPGTIGSNKYNLQRTYSGQECLLLSHSKSLSNTSVTPQPCCYTGDYGVSKNTSSLCSESYSYCPCSSSETNVQTKDPKMLDYVLVDTSNSDHTVKSDSLEYALIDIVASTPMKDNGKECPTDTKN
ncbi:uncharacterized protein LOC106457832 [Limulus polyphemus]|uniref:Uncharacterized protein LOC106457832 n=1 Tax=Limulus polyphemus TaxID=6850 RepID=A0ABM1B1V7_LIMPO|nr:uncharacterized protein LOC106457832 [Limulus polyphemus]